MKYVLMMMLLATTAHAAKEKVIVPRYNDECLKDKLKACGDTKIPARPPYTDEERKVLMCRLDAMMQCRDGTVEIEVEVLP